MTVILEDFVMLGTTVPEPNSDHRVFVCSAGISGGRLIRLYPLARRNVPHRWHQYRVPVQRNPKDSRPESFQLAGDRSINAHDRINEVFREVRKEWPRAQRVGLLHSCAISSIREANARRMSLAIIHPDTFGGLTFDSNPDSPDSPQLALFDLPAGALLDGSKRFALKPYIDFKDELGWHHLQLRDWGAYELQRKNSLNYFRQNLGSALHLDENSSLLVGNLSHQRTTWLIISVLNGIRDTPTLFDALGSHPRIPDKLRQQVYERDQWKCADCGTQDDLTVDLVWPHSRGGQVELGNLQTLCRLHNIMKSDRVG